MINRLQSVLRSAARLVLQLPIRSYVLERMQVELHWLAYPNRLFYKVGVHSYKCLHGLAPPYLSARFTRVSNIDGCSHLRSATDGQLVVPHTNTKTIIGDRGFHVNLLELSTTTITGQWFVTDDFQRTFNDWTVSWCDWKENTAGAFVMLLTLRSVLKCLINNNNNSQRKHDVTGLKTRMFWS